MYLMNAPPVAAIHTEWRTCGPPRGFSQPLCFNDSDGDLSTTGTAIPEKVQMIIESLRSSQSSLEIGEKTEGSVLSGQEAHPQGCKARRVGGPMAGPRPKCRSRADAHLPDTSSPTGSESLDSDSDGSVDRGIEEAIQEYLKEKDGHKRQAEPSADAVQPSKIPRKDQSFPENPKQQHSESNKVSAVSDQALKSPRSESHAVPLIHATKKITKSKSKTPLKESPFKRADVCKSSSLEQIRGPPDANPASDRANHAAAATPGEEDSSDSSSDDGIEEAIQLYQMEKKEERQETKKEERQEKKEERQETDRDARRPPVLQEGSDSSSDDGIEEAIRSYQLEKQKEKKAVLKPSSPKQKAPSFPKQMPSSKISLLPLVSSPTQEIKKSKLSLKKKKKTERDVKSLPTTSCPSSGVKSRLMSRAKGKGNGVFPSKMEPFREQRTPAALKVITTTTAELMCAEAILDISKAVMPEVFNPNVALAGPESSSFPVSRPDDGSDDSSVDSEDGIEQEIRRFLEQKAQMHKRAPSDPAAGATCSDSASGVTVPDSAIGPGLETAKRSPAQKNAMRLSLSQKRKLKAEGGGSSKQLLKEERATDQIIPETTPGPLTACDRDSSPSVSCRSDTPRPVAPSERREQSGGEKSSSLDSDEDLDTAIKDLLKTKKKLKRKTRDMKLKSRKDAEAGNAVQSKKLAAEPDSGPAGLKRVAAVNKCKDDGIKRPRVSKSTLQHKQQGDKRRESLDRVTETDRPKGKGVLRNQSCDNSQAIVQIKEDTSSVDSDDSIEQEIRKFLAEKAKVSTSTSAGDGEETGNSNVKTGGTAPPEKSITLENQLAEIPKVEYSQFPDSRPPLRISEQRKSRDGGFSPSTPISLPAHPSSATNLPSDPRFSSAFSHSPCSLEPADGAAAARTDGSRRSGSAKSDSQNTTPEQAVCSRPVPGRSTLPPSADQWHESQAIPPTAEAKDTIQGASLFHTAAPSPKKGETATTTYPAYVWGVGIPHRRRNTGPALDTPVTVCPSARNSRSVVPFHCSAEPPMAANSRHPTPMRKLSRQPPGSFFMRGVATGGHWGQLSMPELSQSVVRMARDQSTFVELSPGKTSHVQVRSREASEGKDRGDLSPGERERGRENRMIEERRQAGRTEDDCVDETDTEEVKSPEKKQGRPTLSLSRAMSHGISLTRSTSAVVSLAKAISPGVSLSPYIALNTEERSERFHRRCLALKNQEATKSNKVHILKRTTKRTKKCVKRMLQFLPSSMIN